MKIRTVQLTKGANNNKAQEIRGQTNIMYKIADSGDL